MCSRQEEGCCLRTRCGNSQRLVKALLLASRRGHAQLGELPHSHMLWPSRQVGGRLLHAHLCRSVDCCCQVVLAVPWVVPVRYAHVVHHVPIVLGSLWKNAFCSCMCSMCVGVAGALAAAACSRHTGGTGGILWCWVQSPKCPLSGCPMCGPCYCQHVCGTCTRVGVLCYVVYSLTGLVYLRAVLG